MRFKALLLALTLALLPRLSFAQSAISLNPSSQNAGAFNVSGVPLSLTWDGALGAVGSSGVMPYVAPCSGHFVSLNCTATLTGSCTTGPTINVTDITGSTTGTAVSPTTTVATIATHTETLAFAAGDTIGFAQTASTGTCTTPTYACTATLICP